MRLSDTLAAAADLADEQGSAGLAAQLRRLATNHRASAILEDGPSDPEQVMHSTGDVARYLDVTPSYVVKLAKRHDVGQRVGRDWMFTAADLAVLRGRNTDVGRPARPENGT